MQYINDPEPGEDWVHIETLDPALWIAVHFDDAAVARNKLAAWMMQRGYATGHGDTMEQLLEELGLEIEDRIDAICTDKPTNATWKC